MAETPSYRRDPHLPHGAAQAPKRGKFDPFLTGKDPHLKEAKDKLEEENEELKKKLNKEILKSKSLYLFVFFILLAIILKVIFHFGDLLISLIFPFFIFIIALEAHSLGYLNIMTYTARMISSPRKKPPS